jgi:hypothetical protein
MPELDFQIIGVEADAEGLTPLIRFKARATNRSSPDKIHAVLLHAQIQIQSPQRMYNSREKGRLVELFGQPECWGQTLRNRLWATTDTTVGAFSEETSVNLFVACSYDLTVPVTKYFYALEGGEVPLLFLFSGSVFYEAPEGRLQVQPIPWNKESAFRMPLAAWEGMIDQHFPNTAWIHMRRDVFDRLYAFKRAQGDATWEQTMERLLPENRSEKAEAVA